MQIHNVLLNINETKRQKIFFFLERIQLQKIEQWIKQNFRTNPKATSELEKKKLYTVHIEIVSYIMFLSLEYEIFFLRTKIVTRNEKCKNPKNWKPKTGLFKYHHTGCFVSCLFANSPLSLSNSFGENIVLTTITHHAVFQVELPPVFTAMNLLWQHQKW